MDVWRLTIAALRRWYVLIPLLALTGVGVMMAGQQTAPEYEAEASAMIAPERVPAEVFNPYGDLSGAQEALGIVLNSPDARQAIAEQDLVPTYEIGAAPRSSIIQIAVRAGSPGVARDTAQAVIDYASQELADRQNEANLPERSQYTVDVLAAPALVGAVETSTLRTQAVIGALGVGLSVLVAVLFDDIIGLFKQTRAKRRRRSRERTTDHDEFDDEYDEHPGQLTLDDIPVVDAYVDTPSYNGRATEPRAPRRKAGDSDRIPYVEGSEWPSPAPEGRPRSRPSTRSHVSLLAQAHADATAKAEQQEAEADGEEESAASTARSNMPDDDASREDVASRETLASREAVSISPRRETAEQRDDDRP